ncbi:MULTISPECIES: HEPN domain-containing protein [Pyrobaculum]|uniref:HEPN domain protein n=1 Tax=Pyrobaculum arsenaticum (strain DSM 13514 / JCM 11321 / PZ6) TaxID=340102 RepID=A4WJD2_PYRAR|nr:HEPN domain-containing protein [Pyrobaculum arsenaticum]ABP50499.1 HEPN domain protein [Pyrobaculum arsenaticum DSM 13514]
MHFKWLERHVRHFQEALRGLERGDGYWTCYNAYISVRALLMGVLGFDPYKDVTTVATLTALVKKALPNAPGDVIDCAKCLEKRLSEPLGDRCVKCADKIVEYIKTLPLSPATKIADL